MSQAIGYTNDVMAELESVHSAHPPVGPIQDYAVIGDTRTAALCSKAGAIDWLCLPIFDSEPVFGRLVGGDQWGSFILAPQAVRSMTRRYLGDSAVLETRFETDRGTAILTEGMVVDLQGALLPQALLVRRIEARGSPVDLFAYFDPRRGGVAPRTRRWGDALVCSWGSVSLALRASSSVSMSAAHAARITLAPGQQITFALSLADREPLVATDPSDAWESLEATRRFWQSWSDEIAYGGPRRHSVVRSLLTLRLLTFSPSGAPVAAPTTSLPESRDGGANWDYRYSWPRDASIGIETFLRAGRTEEATSFLRWLRHASRLTHPRLAPLYTVYGRDPKEERILDGVPGYDGIGPVRIGNRAARQHQLDVYGWVMEGAWQLTRQDEYLDRATWRDWSAFADYVADHWREPDAGIWEERHRVRHHVHSKLMCWLALDRACRIAEARKSGGRAARRSHRWGEQRDTVAGDIITRGFDERRGTYRRDYDSDELDAALLSVLPAFEPPDSPRLLGTIKALRLELGAGGPLLYRFRQESDPRSTGEGAFVACSFWLVEALVHARRLEEARQIFDDCCLAANDVGLFAEEIEPSTGAFLGNFPQALSHATAAQAALALEGATEVAERPRAAFRKRRAP